MVFPDSGGWKYMIIGHLTLASVRQVQRTKFLYSACTKPWFKSFARRVFTLPFSGSLTKISMQLSTISNFYSFLRKIINGQIYRSIHYLYVGDSAWFFQVWYHIYLITLTADISWKQLIAGTNMISCRVPVPYLSWLKKWPSTMINKRCLQPLTDMTSWNCAITIMGGNIAAVEIFVSISKKQSGVPDNIPFRMLHSLGQ